MMMRFHSSEIHDGEYNTCESYCKQYLRYADNLTPAEEIYIHEEEKYDVEISYDKKHSCIDLLESAIHDDIVKITQYSEPDADCSIHSCDVRYLEYDSSTEEDDDARTIAIEESETLVCTRGECFIDDIDS